MLTYVEERGQITGFFCMTRDEQHRGFSFDRESSFSPGFIRSIDLFDFPNFPVEFEEVNVYDKVTSVSRVP